MEDGDLVAGLDVGSSKVCCVAAKVSEHGEPTIVGFGSSPSLGIKSGNVVDIDRTVQGIDDAVRKASSQAGESIASVYLGISGSHVQTMNSRGVAAITSPNQAIRPADRDRAVDQSKVIVVPSDRQIIHTIPRMFSIDGTCGVRQPVGMFGSRLEVETHITMAGSTHVANLDKCVLDAGLDIEERVLASLAAGAAVLLPGESEQGVCLIDIGAGTTDVAVFTDGEIHTAFVQPVAGNHITNDIAQVLRVTAQEAERLKTVSGHALADAIGENEVVEVTQIGRTEPRPLRRRALCQIIEARVKEIFGLVKNGLQQNGVYDACVAGVVLTGGSSRLSGLEECAQCTLGLPVRIGLPSGIGTLATSGTGGSGGYTAKNVSIPQGMDSPEFAVAVGLVRWAARVQVGRMNYGSGGLIQTLVEWFRRLVGKS